MEDLVVELVVIFVYAVVTYNWVVEMFQVIDIDYVLVNDGVAVDHCFVELV